ncbi:cytochrome P450 [Exidia glandulosa HHB12029]|uniref:Cytochrome P450 n=1 Tax=Exidia glandulosa HHB12029 TaxID=1314781 RepID=A0A165KPC7_EXIGL|nr:cytochrome P450 [Exidia glandulosa HHB12029]
MSTREDVLRLVHFAADAWKELVLASLGVYATYKLAGAALDLWHSTQSPLRDLRTPSEPAHWMFGHMRTMLNCNSNEIQERWTAQLGETFAIRSLFGRYQLVTTDLRSNTHVLFASNVFQKSAPKRRGLRKLMGEGALWAEGAQHRAQRRLLNPAFGISHVRDMTETFLESGAKACPLREIWNNKCLEAGGSAQLNALAWLGHATLDAIGKACFDHEFGTLDGHTSELAEAFEQLFRTDVTAADQIRMMVNDKLPIVRAILPGRREKLVEVGKKKMDEACLRIVQEKKEAILAEMSGGKIDKRDVAGNDVISLLLRANLAADVDPAMRLSDEEVLAQIPTFLAAGHETTSTETTWAMYALAKDAKVQKRLRDELLAVPTDAPSFDTLNALPYLDQVIREVLRLHTVATFLTRQAMEDDVVPLAKPIVDRHGRTLSHIKMQKGDEVMIPIWLINRSKEIWGPDADKFIPERWDNIPQEASNIPGIAPNLMSFIGGPRACIGFRFAIAEMKALLFHIVRGFEFKLTVDPDTELWSRTAIIMRPQLRASNSVELPVTLTPIA